MAPKALVEGLKAIGWFEGRSPRAAAQLLKRLEQLEADGCPAELLYRETADVTYLTDGAEDEDSYQRLIQDFAAASRGRFAPSGVTSEEDEAGGMRLIFGVAGRKYSIRYDAESKYIEADVARVINRALSATGVKERFYYLPTVDESVALVFARPEVHKLAVKQGLIPSPKDAPPDPLPSEIHPEVDALMLKLEDQDRDAWELIGWEPADWQDGRCLVEAKELLWALLKHRGQLEKQKALVMAYRERTGCTWDRSW